MHLLLVCPAYADGSRVLRPDARDVDRGGVSTQRDHRTSILSQEVREIDLAGLNRTHDGFEAVRAVLYGEAGQHILVLEAFGPDGLSDEPLEAATAGLARTLADSSGIPSLKAIRWINRVSLDSANLRDVSRESAHVIRLVRGTATASFDWGQTAIEGWHGLESEEQSQIVAGLVDAQVVWCALEDVQHAARLQLGDVYEGGDQAQFGKNARALVELHGQFQMHNLAYGELIGSVQGPRRAVAMEALDAWRYSSLNDRVADDLAAGMSHLEAMHRLRSARYEVIVEFVLLGLALVSALGLVVSLITLAFAPSGEWGLPDDGTVTVPVLGLFRTFDADGILLVSTAILVLLLGLLWWLRIRRVKLRSR